VPAVAGAHKPRPFSERHTLGAGETVDILLDRSNPGRWMIHCHVAEHLGAGMMAVFTADRR
jgi:FtsP/CotA-like multicopper oxidase with cupredoxin domain